MSLGKSYDAVKANRADDLHRPCATPIHLGGLLEATVSRAGGSRGVVWIDRHGEQRRTSYSELKRRALEVLGTLQAKGGKPGDLAVLQISNATEFFAAFWACALGGMAAVPMTTPPVYSKENAAASRLLQGLEMLGNPWLLCEEERKEGVQDLLSPNAAHAPRVLSLKECCATEGAAQVHPAKAEDIAVLFMTSGSTGRPKAVPQTHGSLIAMAAGTISMNGFTDRDVALNWMPTDHVGSLSFLGVMPALLGAEQVHIDTEHVLRDPIRWLEWAHRFRASISWAPNFAFSLYLKQAERLRERDWDLSSLRFLVNAGEAVSADTARAFLALLKEKNLPDNALRPAFGMSETCSGITWSSGYVPGKEGDSSALVSLGKPIPGARLKIIGQDGSEMAEGQPGRLLVAGPSVTRGYWNDPAANQASFMGEWLITGDLGFVKGGELYITGREKEEIIVNGVNLHCHEIESSVASLEGVEPAFTAACAVRTQDAEGDQLAVFFVLSDSRAKDEGVQVGRRIREHVARTFGVNPIFVAAMERSEIPKTEIGKIQRLKLKSQFESGAFQGRDISARVNRGIGRIASEGSASLRERERELRRRIASIWEEALNTSVGPDDTFFELGGNSLLIPRIQEQLERLVGREIKVTELFNLPTVSALARYFADQSESNSERAASSIAAGVPDSEGIAVIGMACRFPGAADLDEFWRILEEGRDTISRFDVEDAIAAGVDPNLARHPDYVTAGPALEDVEKFDASFFNITPREARMMDPQQRVFLETCWEAFEDAGYNPLTLKAKAGIYASALMNTYFVNNLYSNPEFLAEENGGRLLRVESSGGFNLMIANDKDYLPTRVAYKLNLRGPAINVQTACSSSLVAVHMACESLYRGDCELALAGGVSVSVPQTAGYLYSEGMINSPDGRCRAYDEEAGGTLFGNGSGVVLLKPLSAAMRDGDRIHAVIKGTAVNNDGDRKVGFTAPSEDGEAGVIEEALREAGVDAGSIGYVEGHGTGTSIGDPIEVEALAKVYRRHTGKRGYCAIGSVKSNIGHMQVASGIAGFIKAALAVSRGKRPGIVHLKTPSAKIDWAGSPFFASSESSDWPEDLRPRRAAVNSLGIGGTNAHVILEEAPAVSTPEGPRLPAGVLTLSAQSAEALEELKKRYAKAVEAMAEEGLANLAYTGNVGRAHWRRRWSCVFDSRAELLGRLRADGDGCQVSGVRCQAGGAPLALGREGEHRSQGVGKRLPDEGVYFVFTGQGAQYAGMGRGLMESNAVFREAMRACEEAYRRETGRSLLDIIHGADVDSIHETENAQPALFAVEYSLGRLWLALGFFPDGMIGHSVGEYAAACLADVFSLRDAMKLVVARGRLMQRMTEPGAMAALRCGEGRAADVVKRVGGPLSIASVNGPESVVISGSHEKVRAAVEALEKEGVKAKPLKVTRGFHSPLMTPMIGEFRSVAESVEYGSPNIPIFPSAEGFQEPQDLACAEYWTRHVSASVRFWEAGVRCFDRGAELMIEIGPHPALLGTIGEAAAERGVVCAPSLRRDHDDLKTFLQSAGRIYEQGWNLQWEAIHRETCHQRVAAPAYPWRRERHWVAPAPNGAGFDSSASVRAREEAGHPLIGRMIESPMFQGRLFEADVSRARTPFIESHLVFGRMIVPAAAHLSAAIFAARKRFNTESVELREVIFSEPMAFDGDGVRRTQLCLSETGVAGGERFEILSKRIGPETADDSWTLHASGEARAAGGEGKRMLALDESVLEAIADRMLHYQGMKARQIDLGESFQWAETTSRSPEEALMKLRRPSTLKLDDGVIHPGLIDSFLQAALYVAPSPEGVTVVPFRVGRVAAYEFENVEEYSARARLGRIQHNENGWSATADVVLCDAHGRVMIEANDFELRQVREERFQGKRKAAGFAVKELEIDWERQTVVQRQAKPATQPVQPWLLLGDNASNVRTIAQAIRQEGGDVFLVTDCETNWTAALNQRSFAGALDLRWMDFDNPGPAVVVDVEDWEKGLRQRLDELSRLTEFWSEHGGGAPLWLATRFGQTVGVDGNRCSIAGGALWGLGRALRLERPELDLRLADLDSTGDSIDAFAGSLANGEKEDQLSFRNGARFAARLKRCESDVIAQSTEIRSEASYLVTGGFGGLGLKAMEMLIELGARRICALSRTSGSEEARRRVEAWRSSGVRIEWIQGDAGSRRSVEEAVCRADSMGELRGVVHCAGQLKDGLFAPFDWRRFEDAAGPKMLGAWHLHETIQNRPLDFFVCYSSIASALGSSGQTAYAAANGGAEAVLRLRRSLGLKGASIQWGPWDQIGMAAGLALEHRKRVADRGVQFIQPEEGAARLRPYLLGGESERERIVVALDETRFWKEGARRSSLYQNGSDPGKVRPVRPKPSIRRQLETLNRSERTARIEEEILRTAASLLGCGANSLNAEDGLLEQGMDSLLSVELKTRLERSLETRLSAALIFDYPSARRLSRALDETLFEATEEEELERQLAAELQG